MPTMREELKKIKFDEDCILSKKKDWYREINLDDRLLIMIE